MKTNEWLVAVMFVVVLVAIAAAVWAVALFSLPYLVDYWRDALR